MQPMAAAAAVATACMYVYYFHKRRTKLPPPGLPQPPLNGDVSMIRRLLEVIEKEILPKTSLMVAEGNKVFGKRALFAISPHTDQAFFPSEQALTNHTLS